MSIISFHTLPVSGKYIFQNESNILRKRALNLNSCSYSNAKSYKTENFLIPITLRNWNPKLETNLKRNLNKFQINKMVWTGRIDWMLWNKMIKMNKFLVISDLLAWHEANWILTPLKRNNLRHTQSPTYSVIWVMIFRILFSLCVTNWQNIYIVRWDLNEMEY